jgi:hypothetical protein
MTTPIEDQSPRRRTSFASSARVSSGATGINAE